MGDRSHKPAAKSGGHREVRDATKILEPIGKSAAGQCNQPPGPFIDQIARKRSAEERPSTETPHPRGQQRAAAGLYRGSSGRSVSRRRLAPGAGDVDGHAPTEGCRGVPPSGGEALHAGGKELVLGCRRAPVNAVSLNRCSQSVSQSVIKVRDATVGVGGAPTQPFVVEPCSMVARPTI